MLDRLLLLARQYPLDFINYFFILLPILVGNYRRPYLSPSLKLTGLYFLVSFLKESLLLWYALHRWNTMLLQNLYIPIEVLFFGCIYIVTIPNSFQQKVAAFITLIIAIVCAVQYQSDEFSSVSTTVSRLFSISIVLTYFVMLLAQLRVKNILHHGLFWIGAGLLIYSAGTFFMFLFSRAVLSPSTKNDIFDLYWNVNQILYILFCIFSSIGLWFSKYDRENHIE